MKIKFAKVEVVHEPAQEPGSAGSTLCTGLPGGASLETGWTSAREKLISIGHKKATKVPTEQEGGIGPVQPLQFPDLPLEVGMILTACQAHPLEDHSQ